MRKRYGSAALVVLLLLAGSGCSKRVKVEGTLNLNGKPLDGAMVAFLPDGSTEKLASGSTNEQGFFRLTSEKYGDGVMPGEYRVIVKVGMPAPPNPGITTKMTTKEAMELGFKAMAEQRAEWKRLGKTLPVIPDDYQNPGKTPLRVRVPPDGPVVLNIESERGVPADKVPIPIPMIRGR